MSLAECLDMKDTFPNTVCHHLGDAEFILLKVDFAASDSKSDKAGALHCHRYYELHINTGPSRTLSLPTGEIRLETDQFLLICPGCMHYSIPYTDNSCVLSFELHQAKGEEGFYRHFCGLLNGLNLKPLPASRKFRISLTEFTTFGLENTVMGFCHIKLLGLSALVAMLENMAGFAEHSDTAYTPEHTGAFDAALDMMLYSELSLEQIARQLGYSKRHTARLIHRRYGDSLGRIRRKAKEENHNGGQV